MNTATKKKILGLNAAKLYDIEVPAECQLPTAARPAPRTTPAGRSDAAARSDRPARSADGAEAPPEPRPPASAVLAALETVRDPELDEPITSLGFVAVVHLSRRTGTPRSGCGCRRTSARPNFAYLMVADAYDAVSALPGVRKTEVVLEDHFASDAINGGVAAQAGFVAVVRRRGRRRAARAARRLPAQGGHGRHRPGLPAAAGARAPTRPRCWS